MSKRVAFFAGLGGFLLGPVITPMQRYKKEIIHDLGGVDSGTHTLREDRFNVGVKLFFLMPYLILRGLLFDSFRNAYKFYKQGSQSTNTASFGAMVAQGMHPLTNALSPRRITKTQAAGFVIQLLNSRPTAESAVKIANF